MSFTRIVKGTYTKITHGPHNMYANGNINFTAGKEINIKSDVGINYGSEMKDPPVIEMEMMNFITNFIVYPRIWKDNIWLMNYNLDWDRNKDEKFEIRSKYNNEIFDNCIKGKNILLNFYNKNKIIINNENYSPPYLRMFKNHDIITSKNVILSLYITFNESNKIINDKISLEYDESIFEVGFTNDGYTINTKEFLIEKKYFNDDYYKLNENSNKRNTNYEIIVNNDKYSKLLTLNNILIKCKKDFSEDKVIKFLNFKKDIVGSLIVKPNNSFIFSKRKFNYIKIKRKSSANKDLEIIKNKILSTYIQDENGKEIKFSDDNLFLQKFTKILINNYFSRIGINFSTDYIYDEIEIDDSILIEKRIISGNFVLKSSEYLEFIQNQYFKKNNIIENKFKDNIFIFISPIEENIKQGNAEKVSAYVIQENIYLFSSMLFNFKTDIILHEIGHELGLKHPFETSSNDMDGLKTNLEIYKENLKIYQRNFLLVIDWKKDYNNRKSEQYPFKFDDKNITNKEVWKKEIDKTELEYKNNKLELEYKIKSIENIILFNNKIEEYHQIYFNKNSTDNIMDYSSFKYCFFDYQFDIIKKLNEEFNHI